MAFSIKLFSNNITKSLGKYTKPYLLQRTFTLGTPIIKPPNRFISSNLLFKSYYSLGKFVSSQGSNYCLSHNGVGNTNRLFSSQNEEPPVKKENPVLMNFPLIVWPSLMQTFRNWIFVLFIIKPYYESDFSLSSFCQASKQAFLRVSEIVSQGNFKDLDEFVEEKVVEEVKKNYSLFDFKQRSDLTVTMEDIFFCFPYQIGIIFKDSDNGGPKQRVFLEITMCYHIFRGFKDFIESSNETDLRAVYDNTDRISVANYRFIKEITKGTDDQWTINMLNHFKPLKLETKF